MQLTLLKNDSAFFEVKIIVSCVEINDKINQKIISLARKIKIDGFRPGKVPISVVEKKYKDSIRHDVLEQEINDIIKTVIKENQLKTVGPPAIEGLLNKEGADLEFILKFELSPDIVMPDFKSINIVKPELKISEVDINIQINKLVNISKVFDREVFVADVNQQVTFDAVGYIDGKTFEGGVLSNYKLVIGSNNFIESFEKQLIGLKKFEKKKINVMMPSEYHIQEIANKHVVFDVEVKEIHAGDEIIIDDEFAKKFHCNNIEELKANITKRMILENEETIFTIMKISLFDQLEKCLKFIVPSSLLEKEINILKSQTNKHEDYKLVFKNKTELEIAEYYKKLALRRVLVGLFLSEYIKNKSLSIENEDLSNAVLAQAKNFPGQEKQIIEFYKKNSTAFKALQRHLLEDKAIKNIIYNEVQLEKKDYTRAELESLIFEAEKRIV